MKNYPLSFAVIMGIALVFSGCEEQPKRVAMEPPFYVPSATIRPVSTFRGVAVRSPAYQVLASSDAEEYFVGRDEKSVDGSVVLGEVTSYSTYTYDQQRISSPWLGGAGYKYRYLVQEGLTFP